MVNKHKGWSADELLMVRLQDWKQKTEDLSFPSQPKGNHVNKSEKLPLLPTDTYVFVMYIVVQFYTWYNLVFFCVLVW